MDRFIFRNDDEYGVVWILFCYASLLPPLSSLVSFWSWNDDDEKQTEFLIFIFFSWWCTCHVHIVHQSDYAIHTHINKSHFDNDEVFGFFEYFNPFALPSCWILGFFAMIYDSIHEFAIHVKYPFLLQIWMNRIGKRQRWRRRWWRNEKEICIQIEFQHMDSPQQQQQWW